MIHWMHRDFNAIKADCVNIPYRNGVINLLSIDVTDEELVFIKIKYKMYLRPLANYTDIPTYLILHNSDE